MGPRCYDETIPIGQSDHDAEGCDRLCRAPLTFMRMPISVPEREAPQSHASRIESRQNEIFVGRTPSAEDRKAREARGRINRGTPRSDRTRGGDGHPAAAQK